MLEKAQRKEYDFTGKDPTVVLAQDELKHFDEGMKLKNKSRPANEVNFAKAVSSVAPDLPRLLS